MKKLLLLSAVLLGVVTASHAGVRVELGIPLPVPPGVVVTPPAVYPPPIYSAPPVVVAPPYLSFGFGGYDRWHHGPYYGRGWDHRRPYGWDHRRYGHGWNHHGGGHHRW